MPQSDNFSSPHLHELEIERIASISNVNGSDSGFVASDNIHSQQELTQDFIDSISNLKIGQPMKMRFTMMLFCVSGDMDVQVNLVSYKIRAGEMMIVHEGSIAMGIRMDPTIRLFFMGFTRKFINSFPRARILNPGMKQLFETIVIKLRKNDLEEIYSIYRVINSRLSSQEFSLKNEIIWYGLQTIECILADCLIENSTTETEVSRKQMVLREFLYLVGKYASTQRNVSFYAQKLCISPKYLGQVVTETSGETPHKWICRQVILEAKALLVDPNLTIQQISEALNFTNQSFFGTFFRQHTGISPKAYRSGYKQ